MTVVIDLYWRVETDLRLKFGHFAARLGRRDLDGREWFEVGVSWGVETLRADKAQRVSTLAGQECQWKDSHSDEVRAMDALE